jgi:choline-sulfatase
MQRWKYPGIAVVAVGLAVTAVRVWKQQDETRPVHASSSRPNVVLISMDTTRPDHLSCYGYSKNTSPNLERLAAGGLRFTNARSQAPWTLPSHMSLFTSLIPSHHHMDVLNSVLSSEIPLLAEILQDNGYNTAGIVNDAEMKSTWGFDRGFGRWEEYENPGPSCDCVHLTDRALTWLETAPAEPFFLFLHYYDPHTNYDPPPDYRRRFGATMSGEDSFRLVQRLEFPTAPLANREQLDQAVRAYDGEIAWLDNELGRLFAGLPTNTLIVVFSDHGESFKEHGWTLHGATLYEETA